MYRMGGLTQCFFFVALSIRALFSAEATSPISNVDIAKEISKHFLERQSRQMSCLDFTQFISINFDSIISGECKTAAQNHPLDQINGAICTSACNELYQLFAQCFGAEYTQTAYKQLCSNGYQGGTIRNQRGPDLQAKRPHSRTPWCDYRWSRRCRCLCAPCARNAVEIYM